MRRLDHTLHGNVERPLEDGREVGALLVVRPRDVDLDGAVAVVPRVRHNEARAGVSAEGNGREGLGPHGYVVDGLFAFFVGERRQLWFLGGILLPASNRDGEGGIAGQRGN